VNVVILKWSEYQGNLPYVVAKFEFKSPLPGLIPPVRAYKPLESFHTEEEAIRWCQERARTIVIDAEIEAEQ